MRRKDLGLEEKLQSYGGDIISSDTYKRAFRQPHHRSSLGAHSIGVARETIRVCEAMKRLGIRLDERKAVRAALLHDLGMLERYEKYSTQYETSRRHPVDSLYAAREFESEIDETMKQAILRHMFPVFSKPPTKPEAIAVCIGDKLASIKEYF